MSGFGSLPSGIISSPFAGKLKLSLSAQYFANTYSNAGFPSSGNGNLALRGYAITPGGTVYTPVIDKFSTSAYLEVDYPGGNYACGCGVAEAALALPGGLYTVGFQDIRFLVTLQKK
jgi:hypothetical protein